MKRLLVHNVPTEPWMNQKGLELVEKFNSSDTVLYLDIRENYQNDTLEDILDQGMYNYSFNKQSELASELLKMMEEAEDMACFICFDFEDIEVVE